jgi:hypothetical protein
MILEALAATGLVKESTMKMLAWAGVAYLVLVGGATMYSNMGGATPTPTADTIMALPSPGSLLGSTGTTAGVLDLGAAAALYFFVLH